MIASFFITTVCSSALAQIAGSSFFSGVRSINPGVAHQRAQALISLDGSKKDINKDHEVTTGGIVGGVQTDVALQKNTLFGATKGSRVTFEGLFDYETGDKTEHINSTTYGARNVTNSAKSVYAGGIVDFGLIGLSAATAKYDTFNRFRVGTPPNVSANDLKAEISYLLFKAGSAYNFKGFTVGAYAMQRTSNADYTYTYYDPSTGAQGSTEVWPATTQSMGFGAGVGFTGKSFRVEGSVEQMAESDLDAKENPLELIKAPPLSARLSVSGEMRLGKLSLGARVRQIFGNFADLEELIPSNLLYSDLSSSDERLETSFNFGWGSDKGITYSAFFSQSTAETEEESSIFMNGEKYPAKTTSTSYGLNLSYYF
ncbi:hypothetical protein [Bdellovibrio sp. HCB288]|uniref:hypothetical protein n=1 Tax=Bdellovibrio sp. HCB288 TaxID=3394355 RepID=UPI0039B53B11